MQQLITTLILLLALGLGAQAESPAGWWDSSTGSKILIWTGKDKIVVTVKTTKGRRFEYPGKWLKKGQQFSYLAQGQTFEGHFTTPNEIKVVNRSNEAVTLWERKVKLERQTLDFDPEPCDLHPETPE